MLSLINQIDRALNNTYPTLLPDYFDTWYRPSTDITEDHDKYCVNVELPGYKLEDLEIEFSTRVLKISGKREDKTKDTKTYLRLENVSHRFTRSFKFENPVDEDHIVASLKNGILTVELPKLMQVNKRKIEIKE
jgi:HSP20 family protein